MKKKLIYSFSNIKAWILLSLKNHRIVLKLLMSYKRYYILIEDLMNLITRPIEG